MCRAAGSRCKVLSVCHVLPVQLPSVAQCVKSAHLARSHPTASAVSTVRSDRNRM
jgi:hypothetical protein